MRGHVISGKRNCIETSLILKGVLAVRIACILGKHKWNGCKCSECGKLRGEEHDWSQNCEKCSICGKELQDAHKWNGYKCTRCKATRSANEVLIDSAKLGQIEVIESALANGANIDAKNDNGMVALHEAVGNGHIDIVKLLVRLGADINVKNKKGMTPILLAEAEGHFGTVKILTELGADITSLDNITKRLLDPDVDVNARDEYGSTMIFMSWKNKAIAEEIIRLGGDINAKDVKGMTSLHWAVCNYFVERVKILIELGADVNAKDNHGRTPLYFAEREMKPKQMISGMPAPVDHYKRECLLNIAQYIMARGGRSAVDPGCT
jgi:hypothetical protein